MNKLLLILAILSFGVYASSDYDIDVRDNTQDFAARMQAIDEQHQQTEMLKEQQEALERQMMLQQRDSGIHNASHLYNGYGSDSD